MLKNLVHILILGFVISLCLAEFGSRKYPSLNFYILPTRGWELLAGSILAYSEITFGHRSKNKILNLIIPTLGLLLIGHSILFFNDKMFHPSFYTLSPIIGVCLIIWFSNKDELITKILSTKLFVGIGLISYSLYLWHYPIFAFNRINEFTQGSSLKISLLGIAILILSTLSYYFIERPCRNRKNKFKVIIFLILISILTLLFINFKTIQKDGHKDRLPEIYLDFFKEKPWNLLKNSDGLNCYKLTQGCKFNISSNKKIFLIGDSHMASLMFDLKDRIVKKNYQFNTSTHSGCFYFPGFSYIELKTNKVDENCNKDYFQKLKQVLSNEKNSIIIFGGRLPVYLSNYHFDNQEGGVEDDLENSKNLNQFVKTEKKYEKIQESFRSEVLELSKQNKIILIYPIPEVGWNVPRKILNSFPKRFDLFEKYLIPQNYITTSYQVYKNRVNSSFILFDSINGENIYRVYPHTLFCNTTIKDRCMTHDDKNIFYYDDDHPSIKGAEIINDLIIKEIEKIELKSN